MAAEPSSIPGGRYPEAKSYQEQGVRATQAVHGVVVLIIDESALFGDVMTAALCPFGMTVHASSGSSEDAVGVARRIQPQVILLSVNLRGSDPMLLGRRLMAELPEARLFAMGTREHGVLLQRALDSGFHAAFTKDTSMAKLIRSVASATGYEAIAPIPFSRPAPRTDTQRHASLLYAQVTRREQEVLGLLKAGKSGKEIARAMGISRHTVRTHVQSILQKLHVHSRVEAAAFAARQGGMLGGPPLRNYT